jgi:SAM-dependent methyltransferase
VNRNDGSLGETRQKSTSAIWYPASLGHGRLFLLSMRRSILVSGFSMSRVAHLAAPHVGVTGKVVGLDLNPGMLAVARSLPPPQGAMVEWREGDAGALPFCGGVF